MADDEPAHGAALLSRERVGLQIVAMLAVPGSLAVAPAGRGGSPPAWRLGAWLMDGG